jgi:hypothetical protein
MPGYNTQNPPYSIFPGDTQALWNVESPTTGQKSQQTCVTGPYGSRLGAGFEVAFSANPGAFTIDVQEADTDSDGDYVNVTSAGAGTSLVLTDLNANFVGRIDLDPSGYKGKFLRLIMTQQPANPVTVTAKASARS